VEAGIHFVEWAAHETVRVYRTLNESEEGTDTRKLIELVQRLAKKANSDRVTARDLQRSRKEKYPTTEAAEAALGELIDLGVGRWGEPIGKPGQGGKVSRPFVLNPTPDIPDMPDEVDEKAAVTSPDMPLDMADYRPNGGAVEIDASTFDAGVFDPPTDQFTSGMSGMSGVGHDFKSAEQAAGGAGASKGMSGGHVGNQNGTYAPTDWRKPVIAFLGRLGSTSASAKEIHEAVNRDTPITTTPPILADIEEALSELVERGEVQASDGVAPTFNGQTERLTMYRLPVIDATRTRAKPTAAPWERRANA
jgi:hypothetical protein